MQIKKILSMIFLSCICNLAFAVENVAKEDTTPPAPEGALTADQIPSLTTNNSSSR